ncbi:MAG: XdhC family protein [Rudaea sp.]
MMLDIIRRVNTWRAGGDRAALATVVWTDGSTPRPVGAVMGVNERGEFDGSVSGGCVEGAVIEEAASVIQTGKPRLVAYGIADEMAWDVGLACGGRIKVFIEQANGLELLERNLEAERLFALATVIAGPEGEGGKLYLYPDGASDGALPPPLQGQVIADARELMRQERSETREYADYSVFIQSHGPSPHLILVGAVHTAIPLARIARILGFRVTVVDGRSRFATRERFPDVDELVCEWPDEALAHMTVDQSTYVVILTHDPKFDLPALKALAGRGARYVGAMGSRQTRRQHMEQLHAQGVPDQFLQSVYGPIGLDLGARSPEEIALSIMAEIEAVRYGRAGGHLKND